MEDGKDSVHISREGIFVKDHEGNDVEISKDGVVLDGKHIMSKEEAKRRAQKSVAGFPVCRCGDGGISCAGLRLLLVASGMAAVSYGTALSHGGNGGIQALAPEICLPPACGDCFLALGFWCRAHGRGAGRCFLPCRCIIMFSAGVSRSLNLSIPMTTMMTMTAMTTMTMTTTAMTTMRIAAAAETEI